MYDKMMGTDIYTILVLIFLFGNGVTQREVTLNSTLIRGHLALPGQRVVFTCVTRDSTLLEWRSNEHIGTNGDDIQIYSVGFRDNVTSVTIPTTYATRVSATVEDGVTVIVSQLFITASEQFPTSSVTCRINGQGPIKSISFNTTARALQEVTLNSTLTRGHLALPGQRVVFTCVTRDSTLLEWRSNEHIGTNGDDIQIYSVGSRDNVTSVTIPMTYATRVSATVEDGVTVIVSQLFITASERFPTSSVTCRINGQGPIKSISFNTTARALQDVRLNSTLIGGNLSYTQQRVVFTCETRNSTLLEWQSNDYIGEGGSDIQISSYGDSNNVTRSLLNHDTYTTRVSVTVEDGVTVIVSQLFITASERFPTSSVTCRIDGQGPRQTISFNILDEEPPSPILNSTLQGVSACPGDSHQFECIALYSHNIEWTSDEYIGDPMVVTSNSPIGAPLKASGNTDTYAVLDNEEQVNGGLQLTSSLNIVISPSIREQNHTITCLNSDLGTQQSVMFRMADNCELEVASTNNEVKTNHNHAAIIAGSIIGSISVIILIIVGITLVVVCSIKIRGGYITSKNKTRVNEDPEVPQVGVGIRGQSPEAEKNKEAENSSPEELAVQMSEGTPNDANSNQTNGQVAKNSTTTEAEMETNIEGESDNVDTKGEQVFEEHKNTDSEMENHEQSTNICSPSGDSSLRVPMSQSVNTSASTIGLSQGTLTDSDSVDEGARRPSPYHEHGTRSSIVTKV